MTWLLCSGEIIVPEKSDLLILLLLFSLAVIFWKFLKIEPRVDRWIVLGGFSFSCFQIVGAEFVRTANVAFRSIDKYLNIAGLTVAVTVLLAMLFHVWDHSLCPQGAPPPATNRWAAAICKHFALVVFAAILICWIPIFLVCFPGIYAYDAPGAVYQVLVQHIWAAHNPVLYTAYISGLIQLGFWLFGNYTMGLALYSVVTALIVAGVFSYCCCFIKRLRAPSWVVFLSFAFFALNPIIQDFVFTSTKEAVFGAVLLLSAIYTIDFALNPDAFFKSKLKVARYGLALIVMCLLRAQGILMIVLMAPLLIAICRRHRVKALVLLSSSLVCVWALLGPISSALEISKTPFREVLSVPMQQMARVVRLNPDSLSEVERYTVYELIPKEAIPLYLAYTADPIKNYFDGDKFQNDPQRYIRTYVSIGFKNPGIYFDSFLFGSVGYFYLGDLSGFIPVSTVHTLKFPPQSIAMTWMGLEEINLMSKCPAFLQLLDWARSLRKMPLLSILFSNGFPFILTLIVFAYLLHTKKYRLAVPLPLLFGYWVTLIFGPVILIRYALPLMMCIPIVFALPAIKPPPDQVLDNQRVFP